MRKARLGGSRMPGGSDPECAFLESAVSRSLYLPAALSFLLHPSLVLGSHPFETCETLAEIQTWPFSSCGPGPSRSLSF